MFRPNSGVTILVVLLLWGGLGCGVPIRAKRAGYERVYESLTANVLSTGELSNASLLALQLMHAQDDFEDAPDETLRALHERALADGRSGFLYVLSELSYYTGLKRDSSRHYLAAAVYAYLYLFTEVDPGRSRAFDRDFRTACDLYNRGLARGLQPAKGAPTLVEEGTYELPVGEIEIEFAPDASSWVGAFSEFLPADAYIVSGLSVRVRDDGLGAPLIAVPTQAARDRGRRANHSAVEVPLTVFLRIEGTLADMAAGLTAQIEVYTAFDDPEIEVAGWRIPLETDLTTPLAYSLGESDIWSYAMSGFFGTRSADDDAKVFLLQPYKAGRIPVVFVHGTASSPVTWTEMFNALLGDTELRQRCQFWFFIYPTANPIPFSASILRKEIERVTSELDPEGSDPALDDMVVIGHSQGGLLARLVVSESGGELWRAVSDEPFEDIEMPEEQLGILRDSLFFEPSPSVERVIFISTPHRGSFVAGGWTGRLVNRFASLSREMVDLVRGLSEQEDLPDELRGRVSTSVRNMDPGNPFLKVLNSLPISPAVKVHSIIAVDDLDRPEDSDDGVVKYESAHLEDVESEFLVRSGHSSHTSLEVILEVRRILHEHLVRVD